MGRRKNYTPEKIVKILREVEIDSARGQTMEMSIRARGITEQTFYRWRREYGGVSIDQAKRFKELESENRRLRKAVSDLTLDKQVLKEALEGKS